MKFTGIAIGILLVILGNIMPKMRRNAMFGLRTKWSMTNDSVWQKSQRFGGIASVLCGLAMIVISAFVPGVWNFVLASKAVNLTSKIVVDWYGIRRKYKEYCRTDDTQQDNSITERI